MNSLANESASHETLHVMTREKLPYLSDPEWDALGRMARAIGGPAVAAMLQSLSRDEQHASVAQFISNELKDSQSEMTALAERFSRAEQESRQRIEALTNQVNQQLGTLEH